MKLVVVLALALVLAGAAVITLAPTASACTPYSVCALRHDLECAQAAEEPADKAACIDLR